MRQFAPIRTEPAYRKVADALLARITDRSLSPGERLPAETELARQFGVNRSTVREAMRELSAVVKIGKPFMARDLASHQRVIHSFALLRDVPPRDMNAILLGHCLTSLTGEQIVGFTLRESKPKQGTKTYVLEGCQGEVEQPPDAAADFLDAAE